ncbi:EVE domain protein [Candidatus Cyrtobacter comes]|uniref:EVE domain protein n=1 Tax=Candidatus Cyrtobacter comes TaxID=675776 RepID=A0ABU5L945_9RICK|nr:EVE domain-containing protein [Candidatus Cyrtobacter comes]MDZ5762642.1 EVE domain protein [Candidatus Cyrtobacter comes]
MNYWLLKSEPKLYSWDNMRKEKTTIWNGVRNYQAQRYMKIMQKGDLCFFYHSGSERRIVGIVSVTSESCFKDKDELNLVNIEISFYSNIEKPIELSRIKSIEPNCILAIQPRLSIVPLNVDLWNKVMLYSNS